MMANLTGAGAPYGVPFKNGLDLALKDSAGDLKDAADVSIKIDSKDTTSVEANAVTLCNQYAQKKYPAIISDSLTPIAAAVTPCATQNKMLFVSGSGGEVPNEEGYEFRLTDVSTVMVTLAKHIVSTGHQKVAVIVDRDNPALVSTADITEQALKDDGVDGFVAREDVSGTDTDFSSVLTNIRDADPDAILIITLAEQSGAIVRQIAQFGGFDGVLLSGSHAWGPQVFEVAGDAAVGSIYGALWSPGEASSAAFVEEYKKEYDSDPVAFSALGYETGWLLAASIRAVLADGGEVTGEALRDAMADAVDSDWLKDHGPVQGLHFEDGGAARYPGTVVEFGAGGEVQIVTD
nr:ABC transporter substrate-binding protein [Nocardioides halotolerans]